jgi:mRNA interferase RelE/StbE
MADYEITFARSARKELENLPAELAERNREGFHTGWHPVGATKLKGHKNLWRIRIAEYRVIYEINDRTRVVDVSIVRHRREVYRDL